MLNVSKKSISLLGKRPTTATPVVLLTTVSMLVGMPLSTIAGSTAQAAVSTELLNSVEWDNPTPVVPVDDLSIDEPLSNSEATQPRLIAQVTPIDPLVLFETPNYAVRVLRRSNGELFMNVYNRVTGIQEQNGVPAGVLPQIGANEDAITYASSGTRNGETVTYIARVYAGNEAELAIVNANGAEVVQEQGRAEVVRLLPGQAFPTNEETIVSIGGNEFSARILQRRDGTFMNVYDNVNQRDLLNGQRAFIDTPRNENDDWQTYYSYGTYSDQPATFYVRTNPLDQSQIEIVNRNTGVVLERENSGVVEGTQPNSFTNNYVVAVPGGRSTLNQVQEFYPESYLERSGQGDFVNAGTFGNRNAAFARTYALQAQGINARVVYRRISYR